MKKIVTLLSIFLPSITFPQLNDDIRLFPSTNHQTENSVAIDPTDNDNILVTTIGRPESGKVHITYFYSFDSGITWNGSETTPNGVLTRGDPVAFFDVGGTAYIGYKGANNGIYCIKSTNKGQSWGSAVTVTNMEDADKEYLAADLSGTYPNNIYAAWTDFGSLYYDVAFIRSTNSGATFLGPVQIIYSDPIHYGQGTSISTASNGNVYLIFARLGKGSNIENAIMFTKSTNGGQTFSSPQIAFTIAGIGPPAAKQLAFGDTRVNSFPSIDVNRLNGIIFIVYADESSGNSDVYLRYSANGGTTWSSPIMVNSQSSNQQWFPSLSVDQSNGKVYVSYFSMDGSDYTASHYLAVSTDNGATFTRTKVSDVNFIPEDLGAGYSDGYMGDYYEIKASNGWIFPCWSHNNNTSGKFQVYVSPIGGESVELDQKLSNNITTIDNIDYWSSPTFKELEIPKVYHLKAQENYILRGEQNINSNEKYNKWNIDYDILNHRVFSFETGHAPQALISQFVPTNSGVNIQNYYYEYPLLNPSIDEVKFKDPWYIDFRDSQYGNNTRNRGMDYAEWRSRLSNPFNPDYNTVFTNGSDPSQSYKGIFLNQSGPPLWNPPYYKVKVNQTQDVTLTNTGNPSGRTHKFYFQNWNGANVQFQNANALETGVVFTNTNAIAQANLIGTQLSDNSNAYNTNSQRKYVKTDDSYLHCVYESMGKVWYEVSSNGGVSWVIQNNGQPISTSGKQPSIDYHYYYDAVSFDTYQQTVIVWQEQYGSNSKIKIAYFHRVFDSPPGTMQWFDTDDVATVTGSYSTTNCTPVICFYGGNLTVIYKNGNNGALMCRQGLVNIISGTYLYGSGPTTLTGTNSFSVNSSIAVNKSGTTTVRLVWEQIQNTNNSSIKYAVISGSQISGSISTISTGSGYPLNFSPSISIANNNPVVSCIVWNNSVEGDIFKRVATSRGTTWGTFQITGSQVNFVNNNSVTSASEKTVIVWSEGTNPVSKWIKRTSTTYSTPALLSNSGIQSQVGNGTDYQNMSAMVFNNNAAPHYFLKSTTDFSVLDNEEGDGFNKITDSDSIVTFGRGGVVDINGVEFAFNIGDILVGDSIIKFIEVPDTIVYSSFDELNDQTRTEIFSLTTGTDLFFSNIYYTVLKSDPDSSLTETDEVNFKAELVYALTNQVVGIFDNITYNENNLEKYESIDYQVDCSGITSGDYFLRLVTSVVGPAGYSLGNITNDNTNLSKKKYTSINFKGNDILNCTLKIRHQDKQLSDY